VTGGAPPELEPPHPDRIAGETAAIAIGMKNFLMRIRISVLAPVEDRWSRQFHSKTQVPVAMSLGQRGKLGQLKQKSDFGRGN
jgi:hypothetical protein